MLSAVHVTLVCAVSFAITGVAGAAVAHFRAAGSGAGADSGPT